MYIKLHSGRLANVEQFCRAEGKVFGSIETLINRLILQSTMCRVRECYLPMTIPNAAGFKLIQRARCTRKTTLFASHLQQQRSFKMFHFYSCEARAIAN